MDPYVEHGRAERRPVADGPLSGLTVAVKDVFDWAGLPTGAGNPDWLATHAPAQDDADVLTLLLAAGATLNGKTITDELAYSIHGENVHGTPDNPVAPGRVTGGSSSGSAAAVAARRADVGLGTDTGGSIRVPSSYCGLWGLRTTHGVVSRRGLVPLAPSFDTVGWMTREGHTLALTTRTLTPPSPVTWQRVAHLAAADDLAEAEVGRAVARVVGATGLASSSLDAVIDAFGGLEVLRQVYATVQGWEAWQTHGEWIRRHQPRLGTAVAERFERASRISRADAEAHRGRRDAFRRALTEALGLHTVVVLPSTPGAAPHAGADPTTVDAHRTQTMRLTCVAGLAGLPQLSIPFLGRDGLPRGVGLLGPAGSDQALVELGLRVAEAL